MEESPEYISRRSVLGLTAASVGSAAGIGTVSEVAAADGCDGELTDIDGHPFEGAIRSLFDEGIIPGGSDCTFGPTKAVTRAECAVLVVKAFSLESSDGQPDFSDIDGHRAEAAIRTAAGAGFFTGYPDGTFRPDTSIRRVEMVVALAEGLDYSGGSTDDLSQQYSDAAAIASWARQQVADAHTVWNGIENPNDSSAFEPERDTTRAEAVKYVYDAMQTADDGDDTVPAPTAQFDVSTDTAETGESITFDASSSTPSDKLERYGWSFGDGTTGTGETVTHSYANSGTHDVTLDVQTTDGQTDSLTKTVTITSPPGDGGNDGGGDDGGRDDDGGNEGGGDDGNDGGDTAPAPEAQFEITPSRPEAGEEIVFDAGLSTPNSNQIAQYGWKFDEGEKTGRATTHVYDSPGEYEVILGIKTTDGQIDKRTRVITVTESSGDGGNDEEGGSDDAPDLTARFDVTPEFPEPGEELTFDAGTSTPGNEIDQYKWTLGDGNSTSGQTATHSYSEAGEYEVTLLVETAAGTPAVETKTVSVIATPDDGGNDDSGGEDDNDSDDDGSKAPAPEAKFSIDPASPTTEDTVQFDASASTPDKQQIVEYSWLLGDRTKARGQSVTHTYDQADTYTVQLGILTEGGKRDLRKRTITVTSPEGTDGGPNDDGTIGGGNDDTGAPGPIGGGDDEKDGSQPSQPSKPSQPGDDSSGIGGGFLDGSGDTSDSSDSGERKTPFGDSKDTNSEDSSSGDGGASITIQDPKKVATGLLSGGVLTHIYRRFRSP